MSGEGVAAGGAALVTEPTVEVEAMLAKAFSEERNGVKLSSAMLPLLIAHYVKSKARSIDDVGVDDPDEIEEALAEEWLDYYSTELPKAMTRRARRWAGEASRAKKSLGPALAAGESMGEIAESDRRIAARTVLKDMELSPFEQEKAVTDMASQGLSIERIVALSLSLVLGRVQMLSKSSNLKYGEDPAISEPVKAARKAGKRLLSKIIADGSTAVATTHFTSLMREFAEMHMTIEAALVGAWWAETQGCFGSDSKSMFKYMAEYFEKHAGRGLPRALDTDLVVRLRGSTSEKGDDSAVKEELKALKSKLAEAASSQAEHKRELAALKALVRKNASAEGGEEGDGSKKEFKGKCRICGEKGHTAKNCPHKDDPEFTSKKEE